MIIALQFDIEITKYFSEPKYGETKTRTTIFLTKVDEIHSSLLDFYAVRVSNSNGAGAK